MAPAERRVESGVMCWCAPAQRRLLIPPFPFPSLFPPPPFQAVTRGQAAQGLDPRQPTALGREVGVPTEAGAKGAVRNWLDRG